MDEKTLIKSEIDKKARRCFKAIIYGGAIIAAGAFCPIMEMLSVVTFGGEYMRWGIYPLAALFLIGMMLIVIAIVKPFRESLCRIFAI